MITNLKPYSAMKDSGVEWLGEVPEHWEVRRLKADVANVVDQTTDHSTSELYVALEHVESWTGRIRETDPDVSFDSQVKRFKAGDVLFGKLRPYLAKVARPDQNGVCVGEFLVLRPRGSKLDSCYVEQFLRSKPIIDVITASTFGAKMPRADWSFIGNIKQLHPSPPEQVAIVCYLDHVNRRVRRFVRAKHKLIGLLEEQKQAVIHRAVTRGLDPDVPLKDSGVKWLGKVPEHWEVLRTRYLFKEVDLRSTAGEETHLSMSQRLGLVPSHMVKRTLISESYAGGKLCRQNDLVLNRLKAHLGVFALAKQPGVISPDYSVFRKRRPLAMTYFERVLRSPECRIDLRIRAKGIVEGFWRLYTDDFYDIRLPVPPVEEQEKIVDAIEEVTADIKITIDHASREIKLLREYRTRLIADVVTGKLDVREAAAQLPTDDEGQESIKEKDVEADGEDNPELLEAVEA